MGVHKLNIVNKLFVLCICGMKWGTDCAHAGAWTLPQGHGQAISSFEISKAATAFSDMGDVDVTFSKNASRLYLEHGLTDKLTLVFNGAHQTLGFQDEQTNLSFSDFDDIEIGARYQIARRGRQAYAVQLSYIIGGGPVRSILELDGRRDSVELRGIIGRSFTLGETYGGYIDFQNALRVEEGASLSEFRNELTVGVNRKDKFSLMGQLLRSELSSEADRGFNVPITRQLKAKLAIGYKTKKNRNVEVGLFETIGGRNIVRERGVSFATTYLY